LYYCSRFCQFFERAPVLPVGCIRGSRLQQMRPDVQGRHAEAHLFMPSVQQHSGQTASRRFCSCAHAFHRWRLCCNRFASGYLSCGNPVRVQAFVPRAHEYVHRAAHLHASSWMKALCLPTCPVPASKRLKDCVMSIAAVARNLLCPHDIIQRRVSKLHFADAAKNCAIHDTPSTCSTAQANDCLSLSTMASHAVERADDCSELNACPSTGALHATTEQPAQQHHTMPHDIHEQRLLTLQVDAVASCRCRVRPHECQCAISTMIPKMRA
jgi:hypothetical protein